MDLAKTRLEMCSRCPYYTRLKVCKVCKCFMPIKARVKKAKCPLKLWER